MTDDTLRQECEKLLDGLEATYSDVALYGGTLVDVDKKYKADCAKLLAFARAQQAKGLREAAAIAAASAILDKPASDEFESGYENGCVSVSLKLDAQATAREGKS